jgi:hypothetical protein
VARVCLTRGCACVIPYGEGNHGRHHHGPAGKDALNAWVLEKVRASYLSVRNNRADPLRTAPLPPQFYAVGIPHVS